MIDANSPACGSSNRRNVDYESNFKISKYFENLIKIQKPIILDVGGHKGESVVFFKNIFPKSIIYSFEPSIENYEKLSKICESYASSFAIPFAVSNKKGECKFYSQKYSHLGSLKKINKRSIDSIDYAKKAENNPEKVSTIKLDDFINEKIIEKVDILKIDVQGSELQVLQGARQSLSKMKVVIAEINIFDFYETENKKLSKIFSLLEANGFQLFDILKISKNPKNFRTDWFEAVFLRI